MGLGVMVSLPGIGVTLNVTVKTAMQDVLRNEAHHSRNRSSGG